MKSREMDRAAIDGKVASSEPSSLPNNPGGGGPGGFEVAPVDVLEDTAINELTPDFTPDFTAAELRDFLVADHLESHADPGFKERLRKKLWAFIRDRYGSGSSSSDCS